MSVSYYEYFEVRHKVFQQEQEIEELKEKVAKLEALVATLLKEKEDMQKRAS